MKAFSWALGGARRERLSAALAAFRTEKFIQSNPSDTYQKMVDQAIEDVEQSLLDGRLQAGWGSLATARRLELLTLSGEALETRTEALGREANRKLNGWRKEAATVLLPLNSGEGANRDNTLKISAKQAGTASEDTDAAGRASPAPVGEVRREPQDPARRPLTDDELRARAWVVSQLVDGAADNVYFKQAVTSEAVLMLLRILAVLVVVTIAVMTPTVVFPSLPTSPKSLGLLPYVALFGAMGACFSGLRSLLGPSQANLPEAQLSSFATAIRPAIGAVSAIVVFLAQVGGLVSIATGHTAGVLTVAFVAGFSEALIVRVIGDQEKAGQSLALRRENGVQDAERVGMR